MTDHPLLWVFGIIFAIPVAIYFAVKWLTPTFLVVIAAFLTGVAVLTLLAFAWYIWDRRRNGNPWYRLQEVGRTPPRPPRSPMSRHHTPPEGDPRSGNRQPRRTGGAPSVEKARRK